MTDRREFLKKLAKGTVYAAPVVKTLAAPDPAASQEPSGKMGPRPAICDLWDWWWELRGVVPAPPCPWWTDAQTAPGPFLDQVAPPPSNPLPQAPWAQPPGVMRPGGGSPIS